MKRDRFFSVWLNDRFGLPKRTLPVSVQVQNSLKADEGWHGKMAYPCAPSRETCPVLTAVSLANIAK